MEGCYQGKGSLWLFYLQASSKRKKVRCMAQILHFPSSAPGDGAGNFSDPTLNIMIWGHLS